MVSGGDRRSDREYLRRVAYASPDGLEARASLYSYAQPQLDLVAEAVDLIAPSDGRRVADVGCGNGRYLPALHSAGAHVVGVDLSAGMLAAAPAHAAALVAADATALPVIDDALDALLMMHMLYHLPEPDRAVREARRVLKEDGKLLVATNGARHLAEMEAMWSELVGRADGEGPAADLRLLNLRLDAEATERLLRAEFADIEERRLQSTVVLADSAPAVRHAASTTGSYSAGGRREELLDRFGAGIQDAIRTTGEFRVSVDVVMFLASTPGRRPR